MLKILMNFELESSQEIFSPWCLSQHFFVLSCLKSFQARKSMDLQLHGRIAYNIKILTDFLLTLEMYL